MSENNLQSAVRIHDIELERDRLLEQLNGMEKIRTKVEQLETIIKTWKDVIEEERPKILQEKLFPNQSEADSGISSIEMPHSEGISQILKETGHALNVVDIESEFRKRNWKLSEANGGEVLRRVLRKRKDLFIGRRRDGNTIYYGLKKVQ